MYKRQAHLGGPAGPPGLLLDQGDRGTERALQGGEDHDTRTLGHGGSGHGPVDPQYGDTGPGAGRFRDPADGRAGAQHGTGAPVDGLAHPRPYGVGDRRGPVGAGALQQVLGDEVQQLQARVGAVAQRVEDGDVHGRGVQQREHGPLRRERQNRSGCAASHACAAFISSGPAAGARSGWRPAHAATYGHSGATALSSRAARA